METSTVTFDLGWLIGVVVMPLLWGVHRSLTNKVEKFEAAFNTRCEESRHDREALRKEMAEHMLTVERNFASVSHLKDVETRMMGAVDGLRVDVKELVRAVNKMNSRRADDI